MISLILVAVKYLEDPMVIRPVNRAVVFNFSDCHFELAYVSFIISEEGWVCSSTKYFPIFEGGDYKRYGIVNARQFLIFVHQIYCGGLCFTMCNLGAKVHEFIC